MYKLNLILFLSIFTFSAFCQKKSRITIIDKDGVYGVKSGKKILIAPVFARIRLEDNGLIAVKDTLGKWGYYNHKGQEVIPPKFINTMPFQDNLAMVKKEDGWGIINPEGSFLVKPVYKKIEQKEKYTYLAEPFYDVLVMTTSQDTVATFLTDSVTKVSNDLYAYFLDGKCGLVDTSGNKISLPLYDTIGLFKNKKALIVREKKWGVMDEYGKELLPAFYDSLMMDTLGYVRGMVNKDSNQEWFLFDNEGKAVTEKPYSYIDEAEPFSVFIFKTNDAYGLMNIKGEEIHKPIYTSFKKVKDGYLLRTNSGQGFLNKEGTWNYWPFSDSIFVLPKRHVIYTLNKVNHFLNDQGKELYCSDNPLTPLMDGLVGTMLNGKFGRIDFDGKEILSPSYDSISMLGSDSALIVFKGKKIGLYNLKRDTLIGPDNRIQQIDPLNEGFYGVKIKGKYGFVDGLGRIRIANRYEGIGNFHEGMAPVKLLGKWGYIDKAEILRIQPVFDLAEDFINGIAMVKKDDHYGLINRKGILVTPFVYDKIERTLQGHFISYKKNSRNVFLKGLISPEGREMIFAKYDDLKVNSDGNATVRKGNKYGVVNDKDLILLSLVYDRIEYDNFTQNYITLKQRPAEIITIPSK